jgi:hypothetical protein
MPKLFWTYAGRMGFSLACSILGALLVSKLGLLQVRTAAPLEKIVFDQSDLTRFDNIPQRVEAGHVAIRELMAEQDAQARRQAAAERPTLAQPSSHPLPHPRPAAQAAQRKPAAPRREPALAAATPAPPLVIAPALAEGPAAPEPNAVERAFDKLASGMAKLREAVASAVRIETPRLPFATATAPAPVQVIDDLRERLRLPAIGL